MALTDSSGLSKGSDQVQACSHDEVDHDQLDVRFWEVVVEEVEGNAYDAGHVDGSVNDYRTTSDSHSMRNCDTSSTQDQ